MANNTDFDQQPDLDLPCYQGTSVQIFLYIML